MQREWAVEAEDLRSSPVGAPAQLGCDHGYKTTLFSLNVTPIQKVSGKHQDLCTASIPVPGTQDTPSKL